MMNTCHANCEAWTFLCFFNANNVTRPVTQLFFSNNILNVLKATKINVQATEVG